MAYATKLTFVPVDPKELGPKAAMAYETVQRAIEEFEAEGTKYLEAKGAVPEGLAPKFSLKYKRLSIAWVPAKAKAKGTGSGLAALVASAR